MPRSFLVKSKLRSEDSISYSYKDLGTIPDNNANYERYGITTQHYYDGEAQHEQTGVRNGNNTLSCTQPCCTSPTVFIQDVDKRYYDSRFPFYMKSRRYTSDNASTTLTDRLVKLSPTRQITSPVYERHGRITKENTKFYGVATTRTNINERKENNVIVVKPSDKMDVIDSPIKDQPSTSEPAVTSTAPFSHKKKPTRHFSCKYCDKDYMTLGALKMHIRTHTLPCVCKICGKAFSRPWLLQGHIRTHTGERPFGCSHCGRAFADRSNLRAHIQTHVEVKKYECKNCFKTFSRSTLLKKHETMDCRPPSHGS